MGKIHAIWRTRLVATSSPYGELGLSRPACHIGSSACPDQLAIWRAQPVPTELATSVYPDQLAIWRARSFSTSSPYGELGWSLPTRQLRLYHINIMHSRLILVAPSFKPWPHSLLFRLNWSYRWNFMIKTAKTWFLVYVWIDRIKGNC